MEQNKIVAIVFTIIGLIVMTAIFLVSKVGGLVYGIILLGIIIQGYHITKIEEKELKEMEEKEQLKWW